MNRHARWVADDRVLLQRAGSALLARAPEPIAGLAERRFHGIEQVQWQARAVVDLVVQLVDEAALDRMPADDQNWEAPDGGHCPLILVPRGGVELSIELVEARLRQNNASETPQLT